MTNTLDDSRVSCIVPTHAREDLLHDTLRTVGAQTRSPDELIVSDDCGSNATRAVVEEFSQSVDFPVRYLDSSGGQGTAGASRNAGAAQSSGNILTFLDDDDHWAPQYLARMLGLLRSSDVDFVVSWTNHQKGDFSMLANTMRSSAAFPRALFPNPGMTGSNFMIKRPVFEKLGGFDPELRVANDVDFCARLLRDRFTFAVVQEPLVSQIGHPGVHLTSRGTARAKGLEAYRAKWAADLDRAQHRDLVRVYHAALRGRDQSLHTRVKHIALQLWYSSPRGLTKAVRVRAKGKRDMFNG